MPIPAPPVPRPPSARSPPPPIPCCLVGAPGASRSVVLNDVAEADEDDEVQGGGCFCFGGGGKKKEKSPAAEKGKSKKKKKNPKKKKGFDDEGSFRNRKMSVAALSDSNQLIELTEAEQEEVKAAQAKVDGAFELDELNGLCASDNFLASA